MGKTIISADGRFEWDEEKAELNMKKHGSAFEDAIYYEQLKTIIL